LPHDAERLVATGEDEESEYSALMAAAEESAGLQPGPQRRVVIVAELPDPDGPLRRRDVVAVHADPDERPAGADPEEDLAWYATQEIEQLIGSGRE
jgi:hypothetical protein